jgi:hypothetical protein
MQKDGDHSVLMSDGNQCNASFESASIGNTTNIKDESFCGAFQHLKVTS